MKRILLIGNPNVGKSVVFSRLTGANVVASNYPGTTVDYTKGILSSEDQRYEVVDVPGVYSLESTSSAEKVATEMLETADIVVSVVDSTNLERNLFLTFELLERNVPIIVALNLCDEARLQGIDIDTGQLERSLGVPVVETVALSGEGIKELVDLLPRARTSDHGWPFLTHQEKWNEIGKITEEVQTLHRKEVTLKERLSEATIKPVTGIPIALMVIFLTFQLIRFVGEGLVKYVTEPFFHNWYAPLILRLNQLLGSGLWHRVLIGDLIEGEIEFMESMGVLTTGLFVPFAAVLPYIIAFYFGLSLLEDSGYLPRLATLVDNVFHKLGIHGQGVVPLFLGLGCNVPGALATRTLETKRERFISLTLLSIAVPCMAQSAMVLGVLGSHGMIYVYLVFGILAFVYLVAGLILNRIVTGESPEIFLEIPPYRRPSLTTVGKKTLMRVRWFVKDAIPWLFGGIALVNILYAFGVLQALGNFTAPLVSGLFGLPREAVSVLVIGFLRKDLAIGMLLGLGMSPLQLVVATTILTIYFPCAATFAVISRELGIRDLLKSVAVMLVTVITVGALLRFILL